jgi:hypothetical protein
MYLYPSYIYIYTLFFKIALAASASFSITDRYNVNCLSNPEQVAVSAELQHNCSTAAGC